MSIVDLVETTDPPGIHAAILPANYEASLLSTFGGVYTWADNQWGSFTDGLDAGHMTFLKEDETTPGRLFAGTRGNGAYIYEDQGGGSERAFASDGKVEPAQPSLQVVKFANSPASPRPGIRFSLAIESPVTVSVYESTGRLVRVLAKEKVYAGGVQTVTWDGLDGSGHRAPSGVYYARVATPSNSETVKLVMVR
jgi:hypothetical protein